MIVWPFFLLLLIPGAYLLAKNKRIGQLVFGLTLLFAGLAFLTHTVWDFDLIQFWPALLILWGLALILQRRPAQ